jgi:hypothetical protein
MTLPWTAWKVPKLCLGETHDEVLLTLELSSELYFDLSGNLTFQIATRLKTSIERIKAVFISAVQSHLNHIKTMLRIITSSSSEQAKKYHHEGLTREGYYSEGQEMPGQWFGKATRRLGLHGRAGQEFNPVNDNYPSPSATIKNHQWCRLSCLLFHCCFCFL